MHRNRCNGARAIRRAYLIWLNLAAASLLLTLSGCGTAPVSTGDETSTTPPTTSRGGGYYLDDGPGDNPPNLELIADAQPRDEPLHRFANRPYVALGQQYVPEPNRREFRQRGMASWYGRRFHGKPTASGEPYDMYAMTAAHPTMPIPSYARVTNVSNGRSVVVRINDRGPFLRGRIIDLSYAAAHRLGYIEQGSALVEVERVHAEPAPAPATTAGSGTMSPPAGPTAASPVADTAPHYVQLGAFNARANAESLRERISREISETLDRAIEVVSHQGLFRVRLGPYRSHSEASSAAARLTEMLNLQPYIVR